LTILLIEDDPATAHVLAKSLKHAGHAVQSVDSAGAARAAVPEFDPELIILDLMLPDSDGLVLIPRLRALSQAPIIVCTARAQQPDRVLALKLGADDFIAKPFDLEELDARVGAVLRRAQRARGRPSVAEHIRVGQLSIVPARATVTFAGHRLQLTPTEYRLLVILASSPGEVRSRAALAQQVWGYEDPGTDHLVDVHVGRLRHKLRRVGANPLLMTVRGEGYVLTADLSAPLTPAAEHALRPPCLAR
jgi:DNA-binding response OmpR family regulator